MSKVRLLRRAQHVARLHHANLARMLPLPGGAGLVPVTNGARTLADFCAADGGFVGLELEQVVWLLLDVLSGLRALHELEVDGVSFVHGAISPQYILLGEPGDARLVPVTSAHLNAGGAREVSGYAAPEALLGETTDARADLFSVGVLLWEALAQRRLFPDGSRDAVMTRIARADIPVLRESVTASWALPLCPIAERALALAPADRFGSALELSSAIVAAVGPRLTSPRPAPRAAAPEATPRDFTTLAPSESTPRAPHESTPRAARWRTTTPLSLVIELPPAPREPDVPVESGPVPASAASPHSRLWQPILAGLGVLLLAWGAWQAVPRYEPAVATQPLVAAPLTPPARAAQPTTAAPIPTAATAPAIAPSASAAAPAIAPSASAAAPAIALSASAAAATSVRPRALRSKRQSSQQADGDYGI